MSGWYEQARDKLEQGVKGVKGQKEGAMKSAVQNTLLDFCRQNEEFAQAVVQGGTFPECMTAVAKGAGSSISDLDAYKRAVSFYFPGAEVEMQVKIHLEPEDDMDMSDDDIELACDDIDAWAARNVSKVCQDSGIISLSFSDFW